MPRREMLEVAFSGWAIILLCQIAALPLSVPGTRALKRVEGIDYFDVNTDFNPLHFLSRLPATREGLEIGNAPSRKQIP